MIKYRCRHAGDFRVYGKDTIDVLLYHDYQVLAFSMPMLGMNTIAHGSTWTGSIES